MSLLSIALPSPQQPLLQVQSKSKSSQSYTLFKYHFAASSVLPSPRLINVSSCHFAASSVLPSPRLITVSSCHFNRSPAEPLHCRWHAPPRRLPRLSFACCRSGVLLHLVRAVSLLLTQWGLAFVRHGSTSTDDDDIITMMMSSRRCRRLPHATTYCRYMYANTVLTLIRTFCRYI